MHILVVNDDGPPSTQHSPYVQSFIQALQSAGHLVSVALPNQQRSWIGKAHEIGKILSVSYYRPGTLHTDDGVEQQTPFNDGGEEWLLVDGTPASCTQLGLFHLFKDRPPIDLVVSGPNYGRNTTSLFVLSSGTLGAALEAACCGRKAIAISFAFNVKIGDKNPDYIQGACEMSAKLVQKLYDDWPTEVDLYNVNVPLEKGARPNKIVYDEVLENKWSGSVFKQVSEDSGATKAGPEESRIREGRSVNGEVAGRTSTEGSRKYKWAPRFLDVMESSMKAQRGDGWQIYQGCVSVTPLKANYLHVPKAGEIKLKEETPLFLPHLRGHNPMFTAFIAFADDEYVQPLLRQKLRDAYGSSVEFVDSAEHLPDLDTSVLQWADYEQLDFEAATIRPETNLVCSYAIRKALIRKHFLANTIEIWLVKHPESALRTHFKTCTHFELDYAEFLDDALVDAWDLNASLEKNEDVTSEKGKEWWILKPGMSDGGNGIRLFSSLDDLQAIFEDWDPVESDADAEDEAYHEEDGQAQDISDVDGGVESLTLHHTLKQQDESADANRVMTSQLRHFIAQPYIANPLLLPSKQNHKFHLRTYVLAVGSLDVYVYREVLALFAAQPYTHPGVSSGNLNDVAQLGRHLTNTCFQDEDSKATSVHRLWDLHDDSLIEDWLEKIFTQICEVTGEVFEAAAREQMIHFQTVPNAFELFGVDFLVDEHLNVWLLELNAYPDLKQTGESLKEVVVGGLIEGILDVAVRPFFDKREAAQAAISGDIRMRLVRHLDLGRH